MKKCSKQVLTRLDDLPSRGGRIWAACAMMGCLLAGMIPSPALGAIADGFPAPARVDQDYSPARASVVSIQAFVFEGRGVVRFCTGYEWGVVCFNLYRLASETGEWIIINTEPVIAANSLPGACYDVADPGSRSSQTCSYQVVLTDESGQVHGFGPYPVRVEEDRTRPALATSSPEPDEKANAEVESQTRGASASGASTPVPWTSLDGRQFIKITTTNAGLQSVTATRLAAVLGLSVAEIQSLLKQQWFRLSNRGRPVSGLAVADGSALWFYAEAFKDNYCDQNVYWLTSQTNVAPGFLDGQAPAASLDTNFYAATLAQEQDLMPVMTLMHDPAQDYWMWKKVVAQRLFDKTTLSFALDHLAPGAHQTAQLALDLQGGNEVIHGVRVELNGQWVAEQSWTNRTSFAPVLNLPAATLIEGNNQLTLTALTNSANRSISQWYLNRFALSYPRRYFASGGSLEFGADSNEWVTVDGFTSPDLTVIEISDPALLNVVTNARIESLASACQVSFVPASASARYLAFQSGTVAPVAAVALAHVAGFSSPTNAADYVVIAPQSLFSSASELARYRQQTGLRPLAASLDAIYNEYGFGFPTPLAIRSFLADAYARWAVKPRYAVLLGDGTYDYRDLQNHHDNLTPPMLVDTAYGLCSSDCALGDVNGDSLPEIAMGRLTGNTDSELALTIQKIRDYESLPPPASPQALLIADAPDGAGNFAAEIVQVNALLAGKFSSEVLQRTNMTDADALHAAIVTRWNQGPDLVNYVGHGAIDRFGSAGYFTSSDATDLQNAVPWPVVIAITCVSGQFAVPGSDCLGEFLLQKNQGGAIAVVAPTGLSWDNEAHQLNLRLTGKLRANVLPALGDIFRQAMVDHVTQDTPYMQTQIYNLLGDPALRYNVSREVIVPLRITRLTRRGAGLEVTWQGGSPPYCVERKAALSADAPWQKITPLTSDTHGIVPMIAPRGFLRVHGGSGDP